MSQQPIDPALQRLTGAGQEALRKTIYSSESVDDLFGKKTRDYTGTSPLGKLQDPEADQDGRQLFYPLDLGENDANHILLFKIYNGYSEQYYQLKRKVQELERGQALLDELNRDTAALDEKTISALQQKYNNLVIDGRRMKVSFMDGKFQAFEETYAGFGQVTFSKEIDRIAGTYLGNTMIPLGQRGELDIIEDQYGSFNYVGNRKTLGTFAGLGIGTEANNATTLAASLTNRVRKAEVRQKETIALYMPHKLNVAHFNTYDTPEFSVVKDVAALTEGNVGGVAASLFRKGAGVIDALGQITGTDVNAARAIAAATGKVINPRRETLFVAPELRKFEFAFEFAPRNEKESLAVYDIIKTLKHHAYPSRSIGKGFFFDMPAEFELEFHSIINGAAYENLWMNKIARCALVEINVDYTAAGSVSTFFNGAPTHINMTLTFQEMELITQEFVDRGY
tara:strand:+ start:12697 stop:14055 length:1359 start_codon:yes stop_codon:yes gene_type:complete